MIGIAYSRNPVRSSLKVYENGFFQPRGTGQKQGQLREGRRAKKNGSGQRLPGAGVNAGIPQCYVLRDTGCRTKVRRAAEGGVGAPETTVSGAAVLICYWLEGVRKPEPRRMPQAAVSPGSSESSGGPARTSSELSQHWSGRRSTQNRRP